MAVLVRSLKNGIQKEQKARRQQEMEKDEDTKTTTVESIVE